MGSAAWDSSLFCRGDFNRDGMFESQDLFDFLGAFLGRAAAADLNHDTFINSQEPFEFLAAFFAGVDRMYLCL